MNKSNLSLLRFFFFILLLLKFHNETSCIENWLILHLSIEQKKEKDREREGRGISKHYCNTLVENKV